MHLWLIAVVVGGLVAAWQYGRAALTPRFAALALLRALAVMLVVALLLDAPAGRPPAIAPLVALDASESWLRAAPACTRWRAALDSARDLGGSDWVVFGDSVRVERRVDAPADRASKLRSVADRVAGGGRPVIVITDGESDDAEAMSDLPRGSRAIVMPCAPGRDGALTALEAPRTLLSGDTTTVRVTVVAGAAGMEAGRVELRLDSLALGAAPVIALAPHAEQVIELRVTAGGAERAAVLRATIRSTGDMEPRNDTLGVGIDVSRSPAAVFVSTAPDYDAREAVAALRGVTSLPTRAYYRVAAGAWRVDGSLARVEEAAVRIAMQDAPMVVLHGDTSVFGPPRAATRGALLLFAPPSDEEGEWFAAAAPASPLSVIVGAIPFDSLPPLSVSAVLPRGDWQGLTVRRGGAPDDRRVALTGWDSPRHVAVLGAAGLWRWRFRGGTRADAYGAFFGALYDWLAAGRSDRRAAVPDVGPHRAGAPIRWRRGLTGDSVVVVTITRRSATGRVYSVPLRFPDGATVTETQPMPAGVYDARMDGGSAALVVNASRELVPRRPTMTSGQSGVASALGDAVALRSIGWLYLLAVSMLCGEWLLRRRAGVK